MSVTPEDVVRRASDAAFGRPLVTNSLRGLLVEAMIAEVLEPHWNWCGADWSSWDFERGDGLRLEVKQSAYLQTWAPPAHGRISTSFDIRERTGHWEGAVFIEERGRAADVYVFAYHGEQDATADHREPSQWLFHVVPAPALPATQRISLKAVQCLHPGVGLEYLADTLTPFPSPRT